MRGFLAPPSGETYVGEGKQRRPSVQCGRCGIDVPKAKDRVKRMQFCRDCTDTENRFITYLRRAP